LGLEILFLLIALAVILIAAELFTNAIEWFGETMGLAEGAVGSVLAAVGTALPETMIPIIAILFGGSEDSSEIGIGAILGAPFLLSTAGFAVTGLGIIAFASRRTNGTRVHVNAPVIQRDLAFFLVVYVLAVAVSFVPWTDGKPFMAFGFLALYGLYLIRTFRNAGEATSSGDDLAALRLHSILGGVGHPPTGLILVQLLAALAMIIGGAELFVENLEHLSHRLSVPSLALALIIAPLATELPEKFNSIIWVRQGKDTLAMGNISGAMVFQSCIPVAVGIGFTDWELSDTALVSVCVALVSGGIVYLSICRNGLLSATTLARSGLLWIGFVIFVVTKIIVE
jgi:cation:H+ antiporter